MQGWMGQISCIDGLLNVLFCFLNLMFCFVSSIDVFAALSLHQPGFERLSVSQRIMHLYTRRLLGLPRSSCERREKERVSIGTVFLGEPIRDELVWVRPDVGVVMYSVYV